MDSSKTGLRLAREVFREDQKQFSHPPPSCMAAPNKSGYADNHAPVKRNKPLGIFILDSLVATGKALRKKHIHAYDDLKRKVDRKPDRDLTKPFIEAKKKAEQFKQQGFGGLIDELEVIKAHVVKVQESYCIFWASPSNRGEKKKSPDFARQFSEWPSEDLVLLTADVGAIKASYAYHLHAPFALSVAFRDLCTIKAVASQILPMTRSFAETMSIGSSFVRVAAEKGDE